MADGGVGLEQGKWLQRTGQLGEGEKCAGLTVRHTVAGDGLRSAGGRRIGATEFIGVGEEVEGDPATEGSPARVPGRRGSSGRRRVF